MMERRDNSTSIISRRAAEDQFIEHMALIATRQLNPKMEGRIFGLIVLSGRPLALCEIANRLSVSKASVSITTRKLIEEGYLLRTSGTTDRRDYYELSSEALARSIVSAERQLFLLNSLHLQAAEMLEELEVQFRAQMQEIARLYGRLALNVGRSAQTVRAIE